VLSEGRVIAPGIEAISEWTDADRFFGGLELFRAGKAPLLIFTGAEVSSDSSVATEGQVLARYAESMGVPEGQIKQTTRVTTTEEEAHAVAKILQQQVAGPTLKRDLSHVLLVTSAFHMSRARRLFERAGMVVTPFPVDFKVPTGGRLSVLSFLPNAAALQQTEMALREQYGKLFYLIFK
jgi:hypothetical protein